MPNVDLNIAERTKILGLLPAEGNFATLRVVSGIKNVVGLSADELVEYEVKEHLQCQDCGAILETAGDCPKCSGRNLALMMTWNNAGKEPVSIAFHVKAIELIAKALEKVNDEEKLTEDMMSVYEKFIGPE